VLDALSPSKELILYSHHNRTHVKKGLPTLFTSRLSTKKALLLLITLVCAGLVPALILHLAMPRPRFVATPGEEVIVFVSDRDPGHNIYVMRTDGSDQTRLTHLRRRVDSWFFPELFVPFGDLVTNFRPEWLHGTNTFTFVSNFEGEDFPYRMQIDGTHLTRVDSPLARHSTASISPDGRWIAYKDSGGDRITEGEIRVISSDGTVTYCVTCTMSGYPGDVPSWSPDSRQLVFAYGASKYTNIYRANRDGSNVMRLTTTPRVYDDHPRWSPDGRMIVFQSNQDAGRDIYTMTADGANLTRLTQEGGAIYPSWSPDGRSIVFALNRNSRTTEIYTMDADGSNQKRLTFNDGADTEPIWVKIPPP
jgi:Tol biopolymer transport system component